MTTAKRVGRTIGLIWLVQILVAAPLYMRILTPVTGRDFLANAAGNALQVRIGVLLTLGLSALTVTIAVIAWPIFRRHSERMALVLLAVSLVNAAAMANESIHLRHMLYLSEHREALGGATDIIAMIAASARASWLNAHFTTLTAGHLCVFVLFSILFRFALVPRALAGFGIAAAILSTTIVAAPLVGLPLRLEFVIPTGLASLALCIWLLARGLDEPTPVARGDAGDFRLAPA